MTAEPVTDLQLGLGQAAMSPEVRVGVGRTPLPEQVAGRLVRVVVDLHVGLPDTFELTFLDAALDVLDTAGLRIGTPVQVLGGVRGESTPRPLTEGEVTALEGSYGEGDPYTVVRGASLDHRLQRVRRTRTLLEIKDSDLARQVASAGQIPVGTIDATSQTHPVLGQDNQTDWAFLRERAEEDGYEVGVAEGKLYFRKSRTISGTKVKATAGANLIGFAPRVSTAGLVPEVEVRAWDHVNAKAVAARSPVASSGVSIGVGDPVSAARKFVRAGASAAGANADLGPAPSQQARIVFDRAVTLDASSTQAVTDTAGALAEQAGSGFAEADGEMLGDARVVAGAVLDIDGVPQAFAGTWTVTRARHVFDHNSGGGYRTEFQVSGRQDRSLLSLTGARSGGNDTGPARVAGVVGGIVTDLDDPLGLARVKVALPWLAPDYESTWAPVVQLTAGKDTGAMFLPAAGDQVLVSFEFGDLRRPYVIGSIVNKRTGSGGAVDTAGGGPGKAAIKPGHPATVVRRGFVSPSGSRLVFHDEGPPGGGKPTASEVLLTSSGDKLGLTFDAVKGQLVLACKPGGPPGTLTIECDGNVEIKAGASGTLTIDGGTSLTLKGKTVTVEGTGPTAIKGKPIQLN